MICEKVRSLLDAHMDGELADRAGQEVEEHLDTCGVCRERLERIREVKNVLDLLNVPPVPGGFSDRVMAEARSRIPQTRGKTFFVPAGSPIRWFAELSAPMRFAACALTLLAFLLGVGMSREVSLSRDHRNAAAVMGNLEGFEWFGPTPPDSIGTAYLSLASNSLDAGGASR